MLACVTVCNPPQADAFAAVARLVLLLPWRCKALARAECHVSNEDREELSCACPLSPSHRSGRRAFPRPPLSRAGGLFFAGDRQGVGGAGAGTDRGGRA